MTPTPISTEDRDLFLQNLELSRSKGFNVELLDKLLAAETYWREAVKNAAISKTCCFCGGKGGTHLIDCAWTLAQQP